MIGNIFLILAFAAIILSSLFYFISFIKNDNKALQIGRIFFHLFAIFSIVTAGTLLNLILNHQFQYKYVYSYSSTDLPFGLLLSTFYAGQEGSFLLWIFWLTIIGLFLDAYVQKRKYLESALMGSFGAIILLLVSVSLFAKNPFKMIYEEETFLPVKHINHSMFSSELFINNLLIDQKTGETYFRLNEEVYEKIKKTGVSLSSFIIEGRGLNPLLQNFWMQIHPPIMFLGFALGGLLFALSISSLLRNEYKKIPELFLPWTSLFIGVLGAGLILGGYWSYGVLGWGGYWGWDPVENSSLVPWLVGVALLHFLLLQKKSQNLDEQFAGNYVRTNLVLSSSVFILILYSTFLTRSGILAEASVHSFSQPEGYAIYFLAASIVCYVLWFLWLFKKRFNSIKSANSENYSYFSRELALLTASIFLIFLSFAVIAGTSAPIFGISVETEYYKKLGLPLAIILTLLNAISLILRWKDTDKKTLLKKSLLYSFFSLIIALIFSLAIKVQSIVIFLLILVAAFALIINTEIAFKSIKKGIIRPGAFIAHLGFAIILFGIAATSGLELKETKEMVKNKKYQMLNRTFEFIDVKQTEDGKKYFFEISVNDGKKILIAAPIMYFSEYNKSVMREPFIIENFLYDIYIAPLYYETANDGTYKTYELKKGEQVEYKNFLLIFEGFDFPEDAKEKMNKGENFEITAKIKIINYQIGDRVALPAFVSENGKNFYRPFVLEDLDLKFEILQMSASGKIELAVSENSKKYDYVFAIEASIKPFVSLIWIGSFISFIGSLLSFIRRLKEN